MAVYVSVIVLSHERANSSFLCPDINGDQLIQQKFTNNRQ